MTAPHPSNPKANSLARGQGALEYLLLIGGAVLIATIVLLVIVGSSQSTNTIIGNNLSSSDTKVQNAFNTTLAGLGGGGGGGPAPVCGDNAINGTEQCDASATPSVLASLSCTTQGFDVGSLSCGATCNLLTSGCSNVAPNAFAFSASNTFATNNNITTTITFPSDAGAGGTTPISNYGVAWFADVPIAGNNLCTFLANTTNPGIMAIGQALVAETFLGLTGTATTYGIPTGTYGVVASNLPGGVGTNLTNTGTSIPSLPTIGSPTTTAPFNFTIGALGVPANICLVIAGIDNDTPTANVTPVTTTGVLALQ